MRQTIVLLGLCLLLGQSLPSPAQEEKIASPVSIPSDAIDQTCEIALKSETPESTTIDAGKIVRFNEESVVLKDATRTVRTKKSVPVLGSIPYLGRLFRNSGIRIENVPRELSIDRRKIKSVKIAT